MRDELLGFMRQRGDVALAAALTAIALVEVALSDASDWARLTSAALAFVVGAAAAIRSRAPLLLLGLFFVIIVAAAVLPTPPPIVSGGLFAFLLLAAYSAAAHTSGRQTLVAGGMVVGMYVLYLAADPVGITADTVVFYALIVGAPGSRAGPSGNGA